MSSLWSLRRPWDNEHTRVLEREGTGYKLQVSGNRARPAVGNDNMTTITFGRSTVTCKFVD